MTQQIELARDDLEVIIPGTHWALGAGEWGYCVAL
jgi:hypothetical protein